MSAGEVRTVDDGSGVRTLTIDHPAKRNALDDATRRALRRELLAAEGDPAVRVILLTGAGGTFCAGGELSSMATDDQDAIDRRMGELHDIARCVLAGPKPVVSAVEGFAYGSGLSLVAASDHVVAAEDARFCASFGRVGLVGDVGLARSLQRRIGAGAAAGVLLFAEDLSAPRAHALGLVDTVVAPGAALEAALDAARRLAARAPLALAAARRLLQAATDELDPFLALELGAQRTLLGTEDFTEGRDAFFSHRPPIFVGR